MADPSLPVDLVDLDRYPLHDRTLAAYVVAVDAAREEFRLGGCCALPGFLPAEALALVRAEATALAPLGHRRTDRTTVYLGPADTGFPDGHPRRRLLEHRSIAVAGDLFPPGSLLRSLYEWEPFTRFVADVVGALQLFRAGDQLSGLNLSVLGAGDEIGWHFDPAAVAATLSIHAAGEGGRLEVTRGPSRHGVEDDTWATLDPPGPPSVAVEFPPGTLVIISGAVALRRVTPVAEGSFRLAAEFTYERAAGTSPPDRVKLGRYGRLARGRRD